MQRSEPPKMQSSEMGQRDYVRNEMLTLRKEEIGHVMFLKLPKNEFE